MWEESMFLVTVIDSADCHVSVPKLIDKLNIFTYLFNL